MASLDLTASAFNQHRISMLAVLVTVPTVTQLAASFINFVIASIIWAGNVGNSVVV